MIGYQRVIRDKARKRLSNGTRNNNTSKDNKDISRHLSTSDSLLVSCASVDKSMIDKAPNLKYIGILEQDMEGLTPNMQQRKITVCNIAGYSTEGIAELRLDF